MKTDNHNRQKFYPLQKITRKTDHTKMSEFVDNVKRILAISVQCCSDHESRLEKVAVLAYD